MKNKFYHNNKEYTVVDLTIDYNSDQASYRAIPSEGSYDEDQISETLTIKEYFDLIA